MSLLIHPLDAPEPFPPLPPLPPPFLCVSLGEGDLLFWVLAFAPRSSFDELELDRRRKLKGLTEEGELGELGA